MDLDLNLLETLDALLQEGSVSRAAKRVGLSTPAMSHALARLRTTLGDEVLVRAGRDMVPTQRALALKEEVNTALARVRSRLSPQETFEPRATSGRTSLPGVNQSVQKVTVRFEAATAPYIRERFGVEARGLAEGRVEVDVPGDNVRWLTGWVLSFGGSATVTSPDWAIRSVAEAAKASLE